MADFINQKLVGTTGNIASSMTAANVKVILNDRVVGFCTEFSWTINFGTKAITTIDSIIPAELMPTGYVTGFTMQGVRILEHNFEDLGLLNYAGLNLDAPYFSVAVLERLSGKPVCNMKAVMINSIENTITAKGLATFNLSGTGFVALSGSAAGYPGFDGTPNQILK